MLFLYGILTTLVLVIGNEIKFDYSLGDVVKDATLFAYGWLLTKPRAVWTAVVTRVKKLFGKA